ncbi:hypothetical protein STEG23_020915 [Scotinomys teguina]
MLSTDWISSISRSEDSTVEEGIAPARDLIEVDPSFPNADPGVKWDVQNWFLLAIVYKSDCESPLGDQTRSLNPGQGFAKRALWFCGDTGHSSLLP